MALVYRVFSFGSMAALALPGGTADLECVCVGGMLRVFRYAVPYWSRVIGERLEKAWVEAACSSRLTLVHRRRRYVVIDSFWMDYCMRHK